jgi:hypothetical protein
MPADPSPAAEPGSTATDDRPRLQLVRVRTPQPPLEDDRQPLRLVQLGVAVPRPPHRPGPRPRITGPATPDAVEFGPTWSSRADLPDPRETGRRLITMTLEALAGRRPLGQLQAMTSPGVYTALTAGRRPTWCTQGTSPLVVGTVHACEPVDGVAEISAVARRAGRAHAVAARLEGVDGRWRCTALQVG